MAGFLRGVPNFIQQDEQTRLVLSVPHRLRIGDIIALFASAGLTLIGLAWAFMRFEWMLFGAACSSLGLEIVRLLSCRRFLIFDSINQCVAIITRHFPFIKKTELVLFDEINRVYLDYSEEASNSVIDVYSSAEERVKLEWRIFLELKDKRILKIVNATATRLSRDNAGLREQSAYWNKLASKISALTGRPLVHAASVPGNTPHTFVEDVDQILQRQLAESPLKDRDISLHSRADGELEIILDGQVYDELGAVTENTVRDLIQSSIAEWQSTIESPSRRQS